MEKRPTNPDIGLTVALLQRYKAIFLILLSIFLFGYITSCGKSDGTSREHIYRNQNVLRYDVNTPFNSLNPTTVEASGSTHIFPLLYSYLFVPNDKGVLKPDLAVKWSFDPEKLVWTIYLRKDALFHNNQKVTSKDIKYSYKTWIKNVRPNLYSVIDLIYLLSDTTLCIRLKKEDPLILRKIWDCEIIPYPNAGEIDYYSHPIGSGPFKFKFRQNNKMVVLEANADYYNGRPSLDEVIFYYQPDKEKAWTRLLSGETDIAQEVLPKNYKMLKKFQDRFYFDQYILRFYTILLYNTFDPLFSNPKVRWALAYAIDREYIVKNILNGFGVIANGPMGVDSPFHNPEIKAVPYNPQKAKALLIESGWSHDGKDRLLYKKGKTFEFTLFIYKENQIEKKVARYIQLCLNDLGIRVILRTLQYEELQRKWYRNKEFQVVLTEISGAYRNPEYIKNYWTGTNGKSIAGCFEYPELKRLIQKAIDEKDLMKQKELFYRVDGLITFLQPCTFLFQKTAIDVMSKRFSLFQRFSLTHEGIYRLKNTVLRHQ